MLHITLIWPKFKWLHLHNIPEKLRPPQLTRKKSLFALISWNVDFRSTVYQPNQFPYFNTPNIQMIPSGKDVLCTRSYFQNNFHCTPNYRLARRKLLLANHAAHAEVLPQFRHPFQKGKISFRENRKMINLTFIEHELSKCHLHTC